MEADVEEEVARVEEEQGPKAGCLARRWHLVQIEGAGAHEGDGVVQVVVVHAVLVVLEGHHAEGEGPHAAWAPVGQPHLQAHGVAHPAGRRLVVTGLSVHQHIPQQRSQLQVPQDQLVQETFHARLACALQRGDGPADAELAVDLQASGFLPLLLQLLGICRLPLLLRGLWETLKVELVHLNSHSLALARVQNELFIAPGTDRQLVLRGVEDVQEQVALPGTGGGQRADAREEHRGLHLHVQPQGEAPVISFHVAGASGVFEIQDRFQGLHVAGVPRPAALSWVRGLAVRPRPHDLARGAAQREAAHADAIVTQVLEEVLLAGEIQLHFDADGQRGHLSRLQRKLGKSFFQPPAQEVTIQFLFGGENF